MIWNHPAGGRHYCSGDYELILLTARGGWRSWNVVHRGDVIANVPTLRQAKLRAEDHATRRVETRQ